MSDGSWPARKMPGPSLGKAVVQTSPAIHSHQVFCQTTDLTRVETGFSTDCGRRASGPQNLAAGPQVAWRPRCRINRVPGSISWRTNLFSDPARIPLGALRQFRKAIGAMCRLQTCSCNLYASYGLPMAQPPDFSRSSRVTQSKIPSGHRHEYSTRLNRKMKHNFLICPCYASLTSKFTVQTCLPDDENMQCNDQQRQTRIR